jgi:hypothetical protein
MRQICHSSILSLKDLNQKGICKPVVLKSWLDWRLTVGDGVLGVSPRKT